MSSACVFQTNLVGAPVFPGQRLWPELQKFGGSNESAPLLHVDRSLQIRPSHSRFEKKAWRVLDSLMEAQVF